MRRFAPVLLAFVLIFIMCHTAFAGDYSDGTVIYSQNFSDVSAPENAGVRKGERNAEGFSLSILNNALFVNCHSDTRSFAILPYYNDLDEYTVETSFSFKDVKSANAYFALMLTGMGNAPDNVTSVTVRANGKCDGFGELEASIVEEIASGEIVHVTVPVKHGMLSSITVSVGDLKQTFRTSDVKDVPYGFPGFIVRNTSAYVYDFNVVLGTDYTEKTGPLTESSAFTDEFPYANYEVSPLDEPMAVDEVGTYKQSPETADRISAYALAVAVSATVSVLVLKNRK